MSCGLATRYFTAIADAMPAETDAVAHLNAIVDLLAATIIGATKHGSRGYAVEVACHRLTHLVSALEAAGQ